MKKYYWHKEKGTFVNKRTGEVAKYYGNNGPFFTGTENEWYETLIETIIDIVNPHQNNLLLKVSEPVIEIINKTCLYQVMKNGLSNFPVESIDRKFILERDESLINIIKCYHNDDLIGEIEVLGL